MTTLHARLWNATTSTVNLGLAGGTAMDIVASQGMTVMAYHYPIGSGEGGFGYLFAKTPSASSNGFRVFVNHNAGSPKLDVGAHSSGSATNPQRTGAANTVVYGKWHHTAVTFDGSLNGTGFRVYHGIEGLPPTESTYASSVNGATALATNNGDNFHIGNRQGTDRTYNGYIGWAARWSRILTQAEMLMAQRQGPLAVRQGLVFAWANGRDWGPNLINGEQLFVTRGIVPLNRRWALRAPPLVKAPAGAPVVVSPPAGALVLTGQVPAVKTPRVVAPPAGALVLTGLAPTVLAPRTVVPPSGSLVLTGSAPTVKVGVSVSPPAGALALTAYAPIVKTTGTVAMPYGALTLLAYAPGVSVSDRNQGASGGWLRDDDYSRVARTEIQAARRESTDVDWQSVAQRIEQSLDRDRRLREAENRKKLLLMMMT